MQIYRSYHNHKVKTEKAEVDAKKARCYRAFLIALKEIYSRVLTFLRVE